MHQIDLQKLAKSFGLEAPPRVNLNVKLGGKNSRHRNKLGGAMNFKRSKMSGGYGQKDKRQFSR